jgi:hypothetical protein
MAANARFDRRIIAEYWISVKRGYSADNQATGV